MEFLVELNFNLGCTICDEIERNWKRSDLLLPLGATAAVIFYRHTMVRRVKTWYRRITRCSKYLS